MPEKMQDKEKGHASQAVGPIETGMVMSCTGGDFSGVIENVYVNEFQLRRVLQIQKKKKNIYTLNLKLIFWGNFQFFVCYFARLT